MTAIPSWDGVGPGPTDAELACAAAGGDRRALAQIYDRYADRLHDFCIGMLRDRDSAADCVQDTFCIAATSLGGLREPARLRPWLYSIARNESLRRLRDRRRERPSEDLPDVASSEAGPATLANRLNLANLMAEAAGGLSDRDRLVLELTYRHGLDGRELADALGVSPQNANVMVHRLRETVERSLGALLVSRQVQANPAECRELATILHGWDGRFTILMRKRISRHIEMCNTCDLERRRRVSPAALLGGAPVLVPAPGWLRDQTMREVELVCSATGMAPVVPDGVGRVGDQPLAQTNAGAAGSPTEAHGPRRDDSRSKSRLVVLVSLLVGVPFAALGLAFAWMATQDPPVAPTLDSNTSIAPRTTPAAPLPTSALPGNAPASRPARSTQQPVAPRTTATAPSPTATPLPSAAPNTTALPSVPVLTPSPSVAVPPSTPAPAPAPSPEPTALPSPAEEPPFSVPVSTLAPNATLFTPPPAPPTFVPPN